MENSVDFVGNWSTKVSVSVDSVEIWATEVLVSISISDSDEDYFSGHGKFSRDIISSYRKWLPFNLIYASSMICHFGILILQFRFFSVAIVSSRSDKSGRFEIPMHGVYSE